MNHDPSPTPLPVEIRASEDALRETRLDAFLLIAAATWLLHAAAYLTLGRVTIGTLNLLAGLTAAATHVFVFPAPTAHRVRAAFHLNIGVAVTCLTGAAQVAGQVHSMPLWYLVLVPLGAGFALGQRAAIAWALVCVAAAVGTFVAAHLAPATPEFVAGPVEILAGQVSLIAVTLALAVGGRRAAGQQITALAGREETIRAQAAELMLARDAALAGSRAKGEFLAAMSHEIRTPLNGIIGMSALLEVEDMSVVQRERVEVIRLSGELLLSVVNDVLDFSKIEAGRMELDPHPLHVRNLVNSVARSLAARAENKRLELRVEVDDDVPAGIASDEGKLRQILVNLVGNAIKFTERGHVAMQVSVSREPSNGKVGLTFVVEDTGIGVDAHDIDRLFNSFVQMDASTTRRHRGTGLGLVISQQLAHLLGGELTVTSVRGEGSRFCLALEAPLATADVGVDDAGDSSDASGGPLSILLVEDDTTNQMVARQMLLRLGYECDLATNGVEAVDAVMAGNYDVVLMDFLMPELDGPEATQQIRQQLPARRQPRIIAMTANATVHDRETCMLAGMDDFVPKPIDLARLAAAVRAGRSPLRLGLRSGRTPRFATTAELAIDAKVLAQLELLFSSEPAALLELIDRYVEGGEVFFANARAALAADDQATLTRLAHSQRSSAAMLGAMSVSLGAERIERQSAEGADKQTLALALDDLAGLRVSAEQALITARVRIAAQTPTMKEP